MMNNPMRSIRGFGIIGLTLSAIFLLVGQAAGQSRQSGEIRGTVTDSSGAVIPGVVVTITNSATGVVQRVTTDETGLYDAPFVPLDYPPYIYAYASNVKGFTVNPGGAYRLEDVWLA